MTKLHAFFKALADPTRLRILNLLLRSPLCVCEIAAILKLPQSLVSRHLAYLRNSGLAEGYRQGFRIMYQINQRNTLLEQIRPFLQTALRNDPAGQVDLENLNTTCCTAKDGIQ